MDQVKNRSNQIKSENNSSNYQQVNGNNLANLNDKSTSKSREVQVNTQSPVTLLINQVPGAQSLYSLIAAIFILFLVFDEIKCYFSLKDGQAKSKFYSGQFSTFPIFVNIWLAMHSIVYLFAYPIGKYGTTISTIKPGYILTVTGVASVVLIKFVIYILMKKASIDGNPLSVSMSFALACESVRIMMKVISYLVECNKEPIRSKVNLGNFTYFLFAPTLLYRTSYPRSATPINWPKAIGFLAEFLFVVYMNGIWFKNYYDPNVSIVSEYIANNKAIAKHELIQIFFVCTMTALNLYLSLAYGFLHSYFNFTAEVLGHTDRTFYKIWWNAVSPADMMRQWNYLIHSWLREYPFKALNSVKGKATRTVAVTIVFIYSGLYHDYVTFVTTGVFLPLFTAIMAVTGLFVVVDDYFKSLNPTIFKMFRNFFGFINMGLLLAILTVEYQVRLVCPRDPSDSLIWDTVTLRSPRCLKVE